MALTNSNHWRKSTFSGNGGNCVEVGRSSGEDVLVRDTKDQGRGQVHRYSAEEWHAFLSSIRSGEFDLAR